MRNEQRRQVVDELSELAGERGEANKRMLTEIAYLRRHGEADSNREMKIKLKRIVSMLTRMVMKTDAVLETPARYDAEIDYEHDYEHEHEHRFAEHEHRFAEHEHDTAPKPENTPEPSVELEIKLQAARRWATRVG